MAAGHLDRPLDGVQADGTGQLLAHRVDPRRVRVAVTRDDREDTRRVLGSIAACLRPPFDAVPEGLGALVYGTTTTLLDRLEV